MTGHLFWYPGHDLSLPDMVRAEGAYVYDCQGKAYLDMESGVWCTGLGHNHPEVAEALSACPISHTGFSYASRTTDAAAGEVLASHGFNGGRAVFLCSGSEAVEYMVRAAISLMPGNRFITMAESYFGAYGAARERAENWIEFDWQDCETCERDCNPVCPSLKGLDFQNIGAFVFEPGSGGGVVRFPPDKLVRTIAGQVKENGGLVLVNEVTTGMGRTGKWWGYEHYGIVPDMVAMGKGLGNGYPVSAVAVSAPAAEKLGPFGIAYAQSHQNDPAGAAVAAAVIRVIRSRDLVQKGARLGEILVEGLEEIRTATGKIGEIRSRGLMIALDMNGDEGVAKKIRLDLLDKGFIVAQRPGLPVLRLDPPLILTRTEVLDFIEALAAALG